MTNSDKIRSLTDEELARWIRGLMAAKCCDMACPVRETYCPSYMWIDGWVKAEEQQDKNERRQVEIEDRWAYMEDGSVVCPRCGKRYERRKFEFVGARCEACGANNIVKTEIKEDE